MLHLEKFKLRSPSEFIQGTPCYWICTTRTFAQISLQSDWRPPFNWWLVSRLVPTLTGVGLMLILGHDKVRWSFFLITLSLSLSLSPPTVMWHILLDLILSKQTFYHTFTFTSTYLSFTFSIMWCPPHLFSFTDVNKHALKIKDALTSSTCLNSVFPLLLKFKLSNFNFWIIWKTIPSIYLKLLPPITHNFIRLLSFLEAN